MSDELTRIVDRLAGRSIVGFRVQQKTQDTPMTADATDTKDPGTTRHSSSKAGLGKTGVGKTGASKQGATRAGVTA